MPSLAELVDLVIGVDTHKHTHTAAIVDAGTGGKVAEATVATDEAGYQELLDWALGHGAPASVGLSRARYDERTRAYIERRRAEGKTDREIRRCLKRYIARDLYRQLEHGALPA